MNTVDRIVDLISGKGITEKKFLEDMNFNRTLLSDWKSGKSKSYNKHAMKIAAYFGVSTDYLLTGKEPDNAHPENDVTLDDFTYAMYNESKELSENNKRALLDMARIMREREIKEGKRKADK